MILKKEIQNKSQEWKVPPETVDKDWVLGHFLAVMFSIKKHRDGLVFKGGTALRKCYFPEYRFSEDLDFTSIDPNYKITGSDIEEIIQISKEKTGILFHIDSLKELRFENKLTGYQIKLKFWGANHSKNQEPPSFERWNTSIKIEIILYEKMVFQLVMRKIFHTYSDFLYSGDEPIPCYDLKEVMAEKLRALVQRSYTAPRDFFDIFSLKDNFSENDWKEIKLAFVLKMKFKKCKFESIENIFDESTTKSVKDAWNNSLKHQISQMDFPYVDTVLSEVGNIISKYIA